MSDSLPTVWPADPHTRAKHAILKRYLDAWMAILSEHTNRVSNSKAIVYVDGFAGPGVYEGNEPGSPIVALQAAISHTRAFPVPVHFLFIEYNQERFESLKREVEKLQPAIERSQNVEKARVERGDCTTVLSRIVKAQGTKPVRFGPAMVFLDQFGWSDIPISLIRDILHWPRCEVFSYLNWNRLNQFMGDPTKAAGITSAYGSEVWRPALQMQGDARRAYMLKEYKKALQTAGAKWVHDFAMFGDRNELLYWLFFCTNNLRGLEEMKKAMWKVDESGSYRFSDRDDPGQLLLLQTVDQAWLANEMKRSLAGRTLNLREIKEFVLADTPCYLWKSALKRLENDGTAVPIEAPPGRKPGTYPDRYESMRLRFR